MKKHFFTLLELIVVITVMAAAAGLGIALTGRLIEIPEEKK